MRVYITSDMEGISGVHLWEQTGGDSPEYQKARVALTREVNAAVEGALAGGATEILVDDGHSGATNFVVEELHPGARYVRGKPKPFWLGGLSEEFDASFFIGCHAMAGTQAAVLDHTMSGHIQNLWVNGKLMGEIGLWACACGHFGVPCVLMSGCEKACAEARGLVAGIETVVSKTGLSHHSVVLRRAQEVQEKIRERAEAALKKARRIEPYELEKPVEMRVEFVATRYADSVPMTAGRERIDGRTVAHRAPDFVEAFRMCFGTG